MYGWYILLGRASADVDMNRVGMASAAKAMRPRMPRFPDRPCKALCRPSVGIRGRVPVAQAL